LNDKWLGLEPLEGLYEGRQGGRRRAVLVDSLAAFFAAAILPDERSVLVELGRVGVLVLTEAVRFAIQRFLLAVERRLTLLVRLGLVTETCTHRHTLAQ